MFESLLLSVLFVVHLIHKLSMCFRDCTMEQIITCEVEMSFRCCDITTVPEVCGCYYNTTVHECPVVATLQDCPQVSVIATAVLLSMSVYGCHCITMSTGGSLIATTVVVFTMVPGCCYTVIFHKGLRLSNAVEGAITECDEWGPLGGWAITIFASTISRRIACLPTCKVDAGICS